MSNIHNGSADYSVDEHKDLLNQYLEFALGTYEKEASLERRRRGVLAWLSWCEDAGVDPRSATQDDYYRYIKQINTRLKDTTIGSYGSSVSVFYEWALSDPDADLSIDENPTADLDITKKFGIQPNTADYVRVLRREGRENVKALPPERVQKIFPHAGSPSTRNELICRLFWQTGIRSDELCRIDLDNMDWDKREITIRSSKLKPHQELYTRKVYWKPSLDYLLHRWVKRRRTDLNSSVDEDSGYLFVTQHKEQMRPSYASRIVKEAAHRADEQGDYDEQIQEPIGVDGNGNTRWLVTAHRLRHSAISHWANNCDELDLHEVRMLAGHEKIDTTLSYITTDWDQVRESYHAATD